MMAADVVYAASLLLKLSTWLAPWIAEGSRRDFPWEQNEKR